MKRIVALVVFARWLLYFVDVGVYYSDEPYSVSVVTFPSRSDGKSMLTSRNLSRKQFAPS